MGEVGVESLKIKAIAAPAEFFSPSHGKTFKQTRLNSHTDSREINL